MQLAQTSRAPRRPAFAMLVLLSAIGLGACVDGHSLGAPYASHHGDPWISPGPYHARYGYGDRPGRSYAPGWLDWHARDHRQRSNYGRHYDRQPHVWRRHDPCVRTKRGSPIIRELKWYKTQTVRVC